MPGINLEQIITTMNKHFSLLEGLKSFINLSLHKTVLLLISLSLTTSLWSAEQTVEKTMTQIVSENSYTVSSGSNVTCYTSFALDANITVSTTGTANCGSFWGSPTREWRLYQNKSGDITIAAASGCTIKKLTITYGTSNGGVLKSGSTTISSDSEQTIDASSITYTVKNSGTATNGQVRVTNIKVVYESTSGGCTSEVDITKGAETNGTYTLSAAKVCADGDGGTVTISDISPASGYQFKEITTSASGTVDNVNKKVTGIKAATTITVVFEAIPTYTVTWRANGSQFGSAQTAAAGTALTDPGTPTSSDCDGSKVFVGWTEDASYADPTNAPDDLFTSVSGKTIPIDGTTYYAVFALETSTKTPGTVISTGSNGKSAVGSLDGVTIGGLGTDYTGHSPYLLRFDDSDDYIQFDLDFPPTDFSFAYKMIGGNSTSTMTIKECATADGTYTDVQAFTISGAQNSKGSFTTTATFAQKHVRMVFTKGSNVGVGNITITGYTGTTSYSDYAVSCTTYTVNATTNDPSFGSVSVDHYTITASPKPGYIADGYTVTSGTANVTQNGNIYTVHPTSDCTVQIIFRAATEYTITLIDNGKTYTEKAYEGTPYILPEEYKSTCPDATFLGWATNEYTDHATGTSVAPSYTAGGEEINITAATTFVAVYSNAIPTNTYNILSKASNLVSGRDYLIAAYASADYPIKATMTDGYVDAYGMTLATSGNTITDATLVWTITKTTANNCQIYNKENNVYLCFSSSNDLIISPTATDVTYASTDGSSGYSDKWDFKSPTNNSYILSYYSTTEQYRAHTSKEDNIYLYARQYSETYTSHPNCCHEPATPLAISAEPTTLIASGVTTIKLEGGNNQNITWFTTGGTLSNQSNTGATLTLSAPGTYTVTATQPDDESDPDNVICGATVSVNITVKPEWTITFKTIEAGVEGTYSTTTVIDGESYTLPDISGDYSCPDGITFAGWSTDKNATMAGTMENQTATAGATWYAMWSSASGSATETVYLYEQVTSASSITAGDIVVFANTANNLALAEQKTNNRSTGELITNTDNPSQRYFVSTSGVAELSVGKEGDYYTFLSVDGYLYAASSNSNHLKSQQTLTNDGKWTLVITDGEVKLTANGDNTHKILRYNSGSKIFSCYEGGQQAFTIWKKTANTKTVSSSASASYSSNTNCTSGALIRVNADKWITAANGQKVKGIYSVTAKGFDDPATLAISNISDTHFTATLSATSVPAGATGLTTTLVVEYTPNAADASNSTTITLTAGEITKTITVNGRSLPDEFLMIAKKTLWYAVPANMNEGAGQYNGVSVVPNDGSEPDNVPVAPSTVVYSLKSVASARYETAGQYVRLAGLGNKALWANGSSSTTSIYNNAVVGESNDGHYEWQLVTTDGIRYSISNPAHPDAATGRKLALGGAGGVQYGLYKESTTFFLVPAGCTSQPQEVKVSPRRTDATFSWVSNAPSMTIDVYTNEEMTAGHLQSTAKSSPYMMLGLKEDTKYWFKLTPEGSDACSVTGNFKTTGPVIDVVEWEENAAIIFVDKDDELKPRIVIDGEVEHGVGSGATATDLFFSKYFEGAGTMKLFAIFNGTSQRIDLSNYAVFEKHANNNGTWSSSEDCATYDMTALNSIASGQEIIFYTKPTEDKLYGCSNKFFDAVSSQSGEDANPRWIECNGTPYKGINFNGNDALLLLKGSDTIDIIGATRVPGVVYNCLSNASEQGWEGQVLNMDFKKRPGDDSFADFYDKSSLKPFTGYTTQDSIAFLENCGINLKDSLIDITTARCILFRSNKVIEGVNTNTDSVFVSFTPGQWNGRSVCQTNTMYTAAGFSNDGQATCNSYQDLGIFNYSEYYKEWNNILPGEILDENVRDVEAKTYEIKIPELAKYSCLNLKFQLTDTNDVSHVYTEQEVQVPIIVKGNHSTTDAIFNEIVKTDDATPIPLYDQSIERCKTCDVVVLGEAVLTKATSGSHDVPQVGNLKVYPGGKVIVPAGTSYTVNSLALRRQEDALALAQIEGTLNIKQPNSTFLDVRIDPSNWHYFTLPYDVNVNDIKFVDGTPAAIGTDYRIGTYDGEHRAATQSASWVYLNSENVLKAGLGYIIGLPGSGKVKRELRFPMANEVITAEKNDKDIAGFHAWGGDKTDEELRPNHKGWNLLGAPYLTYYYTSLQDPLPTGELIHADEDPWQGHWVRNTGSLRYIVVPVDNGRSEYQQVNIANYHMAPFTSYFVQIGGSDPSADKTISYTASQAGKLSIVRRAVQEEVEDNHEVWFGVELVNADGLKDETALLISDKFTDDYDIMDDLVKMRGQYYQYAQITTKPVLASRNLKGEMAFNALPDSTAAAGVPLNFFAAKDGDYRFTISGNYPLDEVKSAYLYDNDNATQKWHNLMESDYTFTTKRGDNTTRFMLAVTVERKQPEITTALDNMSSKLTLTTINRTLVLSGLTSESDIYVYDVSGKLLSTGQYNTSASGVFRTMVENAGVYFVRVCSQDGQQTLQTIVY